MFGPLEFIVLCESNIGAGKMKDDSLDDTNVERTMIMDDSFYKAAVDKVNSVGKLTDHDKLVIELRDWRIRYWNDAIEAAASIVDQANRDGPYNAIVSAAIIRKLKK